MNNGNTDQVTRDVLLAAGAEVYHRHGDRIRRYLADLKRLEAMNEYAEESAGAYIESIDDVSDEGEDEDEVHCDIVRFRLNGTYETIQTGLTLAEAQAHCRREDTHGEGWFDGYKVAQ
jgi:hypothetical protein